jgi:hypothetical protein
VDNKLGERLVREGFLLTGTREGLKRQKNKKNRLIRDVAMYQTEHPHVW